MPTRVSDLFESQGLAPFGPVPWGTPVSEDGPGVYVVAITDDPYDVPSPVPPLSLHTAIDLLRNRPELTLDGRRPTPDQLLDRIGAFRLRGETIQYIGQTTSSLRKRVADYYRTPIGARRPHAGGWFIKLIDPLSLLSVWWSPTDDPIRAEQAMLFDFAARVDRNVRSPLPDPVNVMPFANLEYPPGTRKRHGLSGTRGDLSQIPSPETTRSPDDEGRVVPGARRSVLGKWTNPPRRQPTDQEYWTQPITDADKSQGRIRIPKATKLLFPDERQTIPISLLGREMEVRWDPRLGPDKERSGVLSTGRGALTAIIPGQVLKVITDDGRWLFRPSELESRPSRREAEPSAATRGSQRWIQHVVNDDPAAIDVPIVAATGASSIRWVSPLREDDYAEYRDMAALDLLGIQLPNRPLDDFWPRRGPQWDALGRLADGGVVLVEAKAHIDELFSGGSKASEHSRAFIESALTETAAYMRATPATSWTGPLYQYTNRLAHLYFLRVLNDVPAWLVNCYFVGDDDMGGPATEAAWKAALRVVKRLLGIGSHPLSRYAIDVFVPVSET